MRKKNAKITKEFRAIFSIFNITCNSKYMGLTLIWVADLNSERMKEFRVIFSISSILVIKYAKKDLFSILWGLT